MKRKEFIAGSLCSCLSACAIPLLAAENNTSSSLMRESAPKTCEERYEFARVYVKRLMDVLNSEADESTRVRVVQAMGESCARGAYGDKENAADITGVDDFVRKIGGHQQENIIHWEYIGSPWTGLTIADGYCLCPLTEKGPEGLSGLWCDCSVGYVRYMFERFTGKNLKWNCSNLCKIYV